MRFTAKPRKNPVALSVVACLFLLPASGVAQSGVTQPPDSVLAEQLWAGRRVKVETDAPSRIEGKVQSADATYLMLRANVYHSVHDVSAREVAIPWNRVRTLWVQDGTHAKKGMRIGGLIGGLTGLGLVGAVLLTFGVDRDAGASCNALCVPAALISGALFGGAFGGASGALIGSFSINWRKVWGG